MLLLRTKRNSLYFSKKIPLLIYTLDLGTDETRRRRQARQALGHSGTPFVDCLN